MTGAVLVTGASGLLGSQCIAALARRSTRQITGVWNKDISRLSTAPTQNLHHVSCDLSDCSATRELVAGVQPEMILHSAALLPDGNSFYDERAAAANVMATVNLVAAARETGCSRFVFCSTVSVYGTTDNAATLFREGDSTNPGDGYGWSKLAGEQYLELACRAGAMSGISLRLSGLHGPSRVGGVFYHIVRSARAGTPIEVASGDTAFQFLHLDDAVEVALYALESPKARSPAYRIVNVASATASSLTDIALRAREICKSDSVVAVNTARQIPRQVMEISTLESWITYRPQGVDETIRSIHHELS